MGYSYIPPSIEQILFGNYIKHDRLITLTTESLGYSNSDKLHIYIDMYSAILPLLRTNPSIRNFFTITSGLINLCAHLRSYYSYKHRVSTDFYIVFSLNCPATCRGYYNDYNYKMSEQFIKNKQLFEIIKDNIKLLKVLCPYLPDIYFIEDNTTEVGVIIHDLINKNKAVDINIPNLIISKDFYMYQVVAMNDNTVMFRPVKDRETREDNSYYVNQNNLYSSYKIHATKNSNLTKEYDGIISTQLFSLILSMSNLSCRNIYILQNFNTVFTLISNCVKDGIIPNWYTTDIDYLLTLIPNNKQKCPDYFVSGRFKSLDLLFQHYIYTNNPNYELLSGNIVNLYDPEAVKEINNTYFMNNPLDLNRL